MSTPNTLSAQESSTTSVMGEVQPSTNNTNETSQTKYVVKLDNNQDEDDNPFSPKKRKRTSPEWKAKATEEHEEQQHVEENEVLMRKAQAFMDRIVATHENPNPNVLHALATIIEVQESSYLEDTVHSSTNNSSSAHNVGRLVNLIRENDKLFDLISSKFLAGSRYSVSVQAAAMRLLFSCSVTWAYQHVFEDDVLENIRGWVISEIPMSSADDHNWKQEIGRRNILVPEMLHTYSTGLLAVCLACRGKLVEDVLTSELPAKLMRYLRIRVLGETSTGQKDSNPLVETKSAKSASNMVFSETREENQNMVRNVAQSSHLYLVVPKKHTSEGDLVSFDETERDHERYANRPVCDAGFCALKDACEAKGEGDKKCNTINYCESELRPFVKSLGEEDFDENIGYDSCKQMTSCGFKRPRQKGWSYEGMSQNEQALTSACSGNRWGPPHSMVRSVIKNQNSKTMSDARRGQIQPKATTYVYDDSIQPKATATEVNKDIGEFVILDTDSLSKLREKFCIQCLVILGEHVEALCPVLGEKGVDVILALLLRVHEESSSAVLLLNDILKLFCALASHRKFAALFVYRGGVQILLTVPRGVSTFFDLSSCLLAMGSIQEIMQRICALPSHVVAFVVELSLQLLECQQDEARKNAALFFSRAFVFKAVIIAFDLRNGMKKLLCLLRGAASVRSGVTSGQLNELGSLQNDRSPSEVPTSLQMQIAYHTCVALRQYFRAHLLLFVDLVHSATSIRVPSPGDVDAALDISNEAMDAIFREIRKDRKLGRAFVRTGWHVVQRFLYLNGHITMLELCQASPVRSDLHDLLHNALGVLHIVTLVPTSRRIIVNAKLSSGHVGIAVILNAANDAGYVEPKIVEPALNLLINFVCAPRSIRNRSKATTQASESTVTSGFSRYHRIDLGSRAGCARLAMELEQGYHQARQAVQANNGIKVLLKLLEPQMVTSPAAFDCLRALTCQALLGLAEDDKTTYILATLLFRAVGKLTKFIRDSGSPPGGEQNQRRLYLILGVQLLPLLVLHQLLRLISGNFCSESMSDSKHLG